MEMMENCPSSADQLGNYISPNEIFQRNRRFIASEESMI